MRTHAITGSPVGDLTLVNTEGVLSGLYLKGGRGADRAALGEYQSPGFEQVVEELNEYFAGARTEFTVTTAAHGDVFQHRVWSALTRIPYGESRSYGAIALDLGDPGLARAVGLANSRNPISIIVPCHRVIGSDGSLTGYAGGLENKRYLLDLERSSEAASARLF